MNLTKNLFLFTIAAAIFLCILKLQLSPGSPLRGGIIKEPEVGSSNKKNKQKILFVIDVQDGYDGEFVKNCGDKPGCLEYIQDYHELKRDSVYAGYGTNKFVDCEQLKTLPDTITYDKTWNRGVSDSSYSIITSNIIQEINSDKYDAIVFTFDYLESKKITPNWDEAGNFSLPDGKAWNDPNKAIARVPYGEYLTIQAGGIGTNISSRIRDSIPGISNRLDSSTSLAKSRWVNTNINGKVIPVLYFSKQVDNAFDSGIEKSDRTYNNSYLDNVDVTERGAPNKDSRHIMEWLADRNILSNNSELFFSGILTNRCVQKSAIASKSNYKSIKGFTDVNLIKNATAAANDNDKKNGIDAMRSAGINII